MIFINSSGEYPRHIGDLQLEHSSWQPGDDIPEDWKQVFETEPPTDIGTEEVFYEAHPVEIDGVWYQNWQVRQITEEELIFRNAPQTAKEKLNALGLNDAEIRAISKGLVF
jgi:hypothetical protein